MREVWEETGIRAGNTQGTLCVSKKLAKAKVFEASYPFHKELTSGCLTLYYTHFEITYGPCNLIGSNWCDLFTNCTIFCFKSHLFPSQ